MPAVADMARQAFNEDGVERCAILLMTLDEDAAAEIFKLLTPQEMQALSYAMSRLQNISHEQITEVMRSFNDEVDQFSAVNIHSSDHIRSVLIKAMGEDRAATLLDDMFGSDHGSGIEALNIMEPNVVAELIRDEHPQIIATIIVHLDRGQATDVLQEFDENLRNDIVLRVASFNGVQPAALQELTEALGNLLDGQNLKRSKMGGIHTAAEILNLMNSATEESVLDNVRAHDTALADKIVEEMFVFEDLALVDDEVVRRLLQEIDQDALVVALKGAPQELLDRFTANMATRAADLMLEDMQMRGRIRLSQVEAERKKILELLRRLADAGEVSLSKGDDEYV